MLNRYASAYTSHTATAFAGLFSNGVERTSNATGSCVTTRGQGAVINVYREQFAHGTGRYELDGFATKSVDFAPGITEQGALEASATGRYRITPPGSRGSIAFVLRREPNGLWKISRIGAGCPVRMTSPLPAESQSGSKPPLESTSGPGFLGVEVDNMTAQTSVGAIVLGSQASSEKEYGCSLPTEGALIVRTEPHGPAAEAGLHGATGKLGGYDVGGDLIVGLDGAPIPDTDVLLAEMAARKAGEAVHLEVIECDGDRALVEVTLSPVNHLAEAATAAEAAEREAQAKREREETAARAREEAQERPHREAKERQNEAEERFAEECEKQAVPDQSCQEGYR